MNTTPTERDHEKESKKEEGIRNYQELWGHKAKERKQSRFRE